MRLISFVFMLFCASCASVTQQDFAQGRISQEQFDRNYAACKMETKKYTATAGKRTPNVYSESYVSFMEDCMRSKGHIKISSEEGFD
ncbi:MAG: hypothetical protein IPM57_10445 [Oligoflexia bacterium]|nr:hypothetical protein [Oligoflexia bacterium]